MKHHIIPKYAGGSDDPSNIEEITVDEHADRHRILFEKHGNWQDFVAWKGLLKLITSNECSKIAMVEGGKKGNLVTNKRFPKGTRKSWGLGKSISHRPGKQNYSAKTYKILCPDGTSVLTECLTTFCKDLGFNYNSFHKSVIERNRNFNGYQLIEKLGKTNTNRG
jgi:hypothetical protein